MPEDRQGVAAVIERHVQTCGPLRRQRRRWNPESNQPAHMKGRADESARAWGSMGVESETIYDSRAN